MKKSTTKFLLAIFTVATLGLTSASAQDYKKGDNLLNVGIGLGGGFGTPIGVSFEHGFTEKISGGAMVTYSNLDVAGYKLNYIIGGLRASYHFDFGVEKLDPYAGLMLGYIKIGGPSGYAGSAGNVAFGGHVGARYYLTPKIGAFVEAGYGAANLTVGAAFKF